MNSVAEGPLVDLTIPVHSAARPIARAVASVLDHNATRIRVTVVAHNIDPALIQESLGAWSNDPRVRLIALHDNIRSPAGPLNAGIEAATAAFISVMGSDDELEPGAVDSWVGMQHRSGSEMVITRTFRHGRGNDSYPPVRPGRRTRLDPVKDRLSYRSAPLGLISRARFGDLRFSAGLPSGEDLAFVTQMWFSGARLAFDITGPAYVIHSDADDRVTSDPRPIAIDFAFLDETISKEWFRRLPANARRAVAVKFIRMHVFDALLARSALPEWPPGERDAMTHAVARILASAPGVTRLLSSVDRGVLDALRSPATPLSDLMKLAERRWNYRSLRALMPRNPFFAFHRQGPFRTLFAGLLVLKSRAHR